MQIDSIEFLNTYGIWGKACFNTYGNSALIGPHADSAIKALRWCLHEGGDWKEEWEGISNPKAMQRGGGQVGMAVAITTHEPYADQHRLVRTAGDSMYQRMYAGSNFLKFILGKWNVSVNTVDGVMKLASEDSVISPMALRAMFGTGDLFAFIHSGRSEALPSRWREDTPTRYSALLQEAGVHEWTTISLRDGRMLAGGDGTAMPIASLAPDELYVASLALSILHRRSENVNAPFIVLLPSTLRPSTRMDAARLCAVDGGQVVLVSQELESEAAALLDGIRLLPIVPDNAEWRNLPC